MNATANDSDRQEPCPACDKSIWVIATLNAGECPECGTPRDELFKIARAGDVDVEESRSGVGVQGGEADV